MERPIEFYRDSSRFDEIGMQYEIAFGQDPGLIRFVHRTLSTLPSSASVLDIGCGTGKPVCSLVASSGRSITGIDYSSTMIALSRQQVPRGTFIHENMLDYAPSARFDAAYSTFTLLIYTYDDLVKLMARIASWIVEGGSLFILTLSPSMDTKGAREDENGTKIVDSVFFGINTPLMLPTEGGWRRILDKAGMELTDAYEETWAAPPEAQCNESEVHMFLTAKKKVGAAAK